SFAGGSTKNGDYRADGKYPSARPSDPPPKFDTVRIGRPSRSSAGRTGSVTNSEKGTYGVSGECLERKSRPSGREVSNRVLRAGYVTASRLAPLPRNRSPLPAQAGRGLRAAGVTSRQPSARPERRRSSGDRSLRERTART